MARYLFNMDFIPLHETRPAMKYLMHEMKQQKEGNFACEHSPRSPIHLFIRNQSRTVSFHLLSRLISRRGNVRASIF